MTGTAEKYDSELLKKLLDQMLLIRRFEEKAMQMYGLRKIGGFCHICIGQEAICAGAVAAIDLERDYVLTAYRDHGYALAVGTEPNAVMAELFGKATGCSAGKGGSMHLFNAKRHFFGGNGIVGAHIPIATGVAFKIRYAEEDGAVLCFFGEGAIHQGSVHESMNMARIWQLPIVYVCENNQYGMGTDFRRVSAIEDLSKMAQSYDMPGEQLDGMDVLEVFERIGAAAQRARNERMPSLLEIKTYRYMGHSMSDPGTYRSRDEIKQYRQQDPISILRDMLFESKIIDQAEYDEIDQKCKQIVEDAVQFAESSPEPDDDSLYKDVLA